MLLEPDGERSDGVDVFERESTAEATGSVPVPPTDVVDGAGRRIEFRTASTADLDALDGMYESFGHADRAQGIPPVTAQRRTQWLETLLSEGPDVVAWHRETPVGHASLVPMEDGSAELAIFVAPEYQQVGIGSSLLAVTLAHGRACDVDRVWLTVRRENRVAMSLYHSAGFETVEAGSEMEMVRDL